LTSPGVDFHINRLIKYKHRNRSWATYCCRDQWWMGDWGACARWGPHAHGNSTHDQYKSRRVACCVQKSSISSHRSSISVEHKKNRSRWVLKTESKQLAELIKVNILPETERQHK